MVTVGGEISGYCATGSTCDAISPASVMMMETTAAKIGRAMKNRDMVIPYLAAVGVVAAAGPGAFEAPGPDFPEASLAPVPPEPYPFDAPPAADAPVRAPPAADAGFAPLFVAGVSPAAATFASVRATV